MENLQMSNFKRSLPWLIWGLAVAFFALQFILRVSPGVMISDIMGKFQIEALAFGMFSAVYYVGYAGMQIPLGIMLDRYNPRYIICISILVCVIGTLTLVYSNIWNIALFGRFLVGAGSSAAVLGALKILRIWFPSSKYTFMVGMSVTIGLLGAIYGGSPVSILSDKIGWEKVLFLLSIVGVALAGLIFLFRFKPFYDTNHSSEFHGGLFDELKQVFGNKKIMVICILGGLMVGPFEGFADIWGISFLHHVYNYAKEDAASISSLIFLGMCIGGPLMGFIAEKLDSNYILTSLCALVMCVAFTIMFLMHIESKLLLQALFLIIGIACSYQVVVFAIVVDLVPTNMTGLATAVTNMINVIFGFFVHISIGWIMDNFRDQSLPEGIYQPELYPIALASIPVAMIISMIGFYVIRPKNDHVAHAEDDSDPVIEK